MKKLTSALLILASALTAASVMAQEKTSGKAKEDLPESIYSLKRKSMVEQYIANYGITDKDILQAFLKVPKHEFVLPEYKTQAYEDNALPIGQEQSMGRPYELALMTQLLDLQGNEKVMELGTGSGYHTAILSLLCKTIYTVDILAEMKKAAEARLKHLGYKNVRFRLGEGTLGWPEEAPFDAIIVGFAADSIIPELVKQLKEGGRLVIPVEGSKGKQELKLVIKKNNDIEVKSIIPINFVNMIKADETTDSGNANTKTK